MPSRKAPHKFELVEEDNCLFYQLQEMKVGRHVDREFVDRIEPFITGLDEETAKKVDVSSKGTEWFSYVASIGGKMDETNAAIVNFLNARNTFNSRRARGSVRKALGNGSIVEKDSMTGTA